MSRSGPCRLTVSHRQQAVRVIDEIWNQGQLDLADGFFTKDYVNHGGLIPDLIRGPEAIKMSVALYRSAFPRFFLAVEEARTNEDEIVIRWIAYRRRPLTETQAQKKRGLRGITRCRLQAGKIAESWTVWDSRTALGMLPSDPLASSKSRVSGG